MFFKEESEAPQGKELAQCQIAGKLLNPGSNLLSLKSLLSVTSKIASLPLLIPFHKFCHFKLLIILHGFHPYYHNPNSNSKWCLPRKLPQLLVGLMVSSPSLVTLVSWSVVKVLCSEGFKRFLLSTRPFSEEGWYWRSRMNLENSCLIGSWLDSEEEMKPCQVGTSLGEWLKGGVELHFISFCMLWFVWIEVRKKHCF